MPRFRWIEWNVEHLAAHGITPQEAEWVATHPIRGYPRRYRRGQLVWGQTSTGRWLQVAYARDEEGMVFIYHARDLTQSEKHRTRR